MYGVSACAVGVSLGVSAVNYYKSRKLEQITRDLTSEGYTIDPDNYRIIRQRVSRRVSFGGSSFNTWPQDTIKGVVRMPKIGSKFKIEILPQPEESASPLAGIADK